MKKDKQHILKQVLKDAASTIAFVLGSLSRGFGEQFYVQSQYILDLIFGSKTARRAHYEPVFSLAYHN